MDQEKVKDSLKALVVIILFTFINIFVPFLSIFVFLLWPLPVVFIFIKYGMKDTIKVIVIAALLNGILINPFIGLVTIIGIGFIGFVIGGCLKEEVTPFSTLLSSIGVVLISQIIILVISHYMLGFNFDILIEEINKIVQNTPELSQYETLIKYQIQVFKNIYPALLLISSTFVGSIHYYVSIGYLNKKEFNFEKFLSVRFWYFPKWIISAGVVISLLLKNNVFFNNLNVFLFFLCFVQGFSVVLFYIVKKKNSGIIKALFILSIFVIPFVNLLLILLGLIDMWFDLRKIQNKEEKE